MAHLISSIAFGIIFVLLPGARPGHGQPDQTATVSLTSIREVRVLELATDEPADEDEMFFTMGGETSSLSLDWRIELPAGVKLVSVENLRELEATDSTGRNLAPEDFENALTAMPRYEFGDFGDEPAEILDSLTFTLEVPERAAESFSLVATADATTSTGSAEVEVNLTDQWQTLAAEQFGGEAVRVRLSREMGEVLGVEFSPASAAERAVESLRLNVEGDELEESGSMNDSSTITYFFDAMVDEGAPVKLTITARTGLASTPIRFELKDQKLP